MRRKITLNFNASPTHPTPTCTLHIDWETIEDKLVENLCIVIATDATGDATISFVSLRNAGDGVSLPEVGTNDSVKPLTVHVYGLERTERRIPYLYKACASGVKMLTYAAGQSNTWTIDLQAHSVGQSSFTQHMDLIGQDSFSFTHVRVRNCIRLTASGEDLPQDVLVVLKEHQDSSEIIWLSTAASKTLFKIPIDVLSPGANAIKVYTLDKLHCRTGLMIYRKRTSSKEVTYNRRPKSLPPTKLPDMSLQQTESLMRKALEYMSPDPKMSSIKHLYRNKPRFYFENIADLHDGVMETYVKDYNGDAASCINGVIGGLFFSTGLDPRTKRPPNFSFFGSRRLHVPPQLIVTGDTNMYFSDFYCHYEQHYVTVVVTRSGSHADRFCRGKLPQLNAQDNRFFCTDESYRSFSVSLSVSVEIFYTEDIDVAHLMTEPGVSFSTVPIRGRGHSKKYGIPKKADCQICQL